METNYELNRIVIPLEKFLKFEFHSRLKDVDIIRLWYLTSSGEKQSLEIGSFFGSYEEWNRLEEVLEKIKKVHRLPLLLHGLFINTKLKIQTKKKV